VSVLEGRGKGHRSLTQETLKVPKVSVYGLSEEESSDICLIVVGETWMTPYRRYLADGLLPTDIPWYMESYSGMATLILS